MSARLPNSPAEITALDQAAWTTAVRLGRFTYASLSAQTHIPVQTITALIRRWMEAGAVAVEGARKGKKLEFVVLYTQDRSPSLPRLPAAPLSCEQAMWVAVRRSGAFSPTDIGAIASTTEVPISPEQVRAYLQILLAAGYLKVVRKAVPRKAEAIYKLLRDTGPLAPVSKRLSVVYDGNKREVVYVPQVRK